MPAADSSKDAPKVVYWHRELPPLEAEVLAEHTVEATSRHVTGPITRGDERWHEAYGDLMRQATERLVQEVDRLGGDFAHVLDESVDSRHDDATDTSWLHGRFDYVLYTRLAAP